MRISFFILMIRMVKIIMAFKFEMHTDIGIRKETNQDSLCVKEAQTDNGNILFALICDGMGGLEKGEIASATIINIFSNWFENDLPYQLSKSTFYNDIRYSWERIIKEQNQNIADYGRRHHIQLGSTFTAMLFFENGKYLIGHVGDSRAYKITDNSIEILTQDQTIVANEIRMGRLTIEESERDPRRNVLLQCIGASKIVEPDFIEGNYTTNECYMLCSDGFRHVVTADEIKNTFSPSKNGDEQIIKENIIRLIELNKQRQEPDNISAILIRTF